MGTRFATQALTPAALALAVLAAGCPSGGDRGADDDDSLVVQAQTERAEVASEAQAAKAQPEEAAGAPEPAAEGEAAEPPTDTEEEEKMAEEPRVTIKTTKGDIVAKLYPDEAPKTVANFLSLAKEGYYDDMVWHRVEPGFVIQTGQGTPKPSIPDEVNRHKHRRGALAMAKLGSPVPGRLSMADSASTQFYITMCSAERAEGLNSEYTVFGQVIEGMDVVREVTTEDKITAIEVMPDDD